MSELFIWYTVAAKNGKKEATVYEDINNKVSAGFFSDLTAYQTEMKKEDKYAR